MSICGIIAEYNPFHLGHIYHIEQSRRLTGATHTVAVMSGNFVQRGEAAAVDKFARAKMAVMGGIDLVLELPVPWAVGTAQTFAAGSVQLLDKLGVVDRLSFGSECGDISAISRLAEIIDSDEMRACMVPLLDSGMTFAAARQAAAEQCCGRLSELLQSPNDTLAVEYVRALKLLDSRILPVAVKRAGAAHDGQPDGTTASAGYIRSCIIRGERDCVQYMPDSARDILLTEIERRRAVTDSKRLEMLILHRLRQMEPADIAALPDISEGLENRIYDAARNCTDPAALVDTVKVKRYTHARLRRICLSALLGVTADMTGAGIPYIRVLAMNGRGAEILGAASGKCPLPIITRSRDAQALSGRAKAIFDAESRAVDTYGLLTEQIQPCGANLTHGIITI